MVLPAVIDQEMPCVLTVVPRIITPDSTMTRLASSAATVATMRALTGTSYKRSKSTMKALSVMQPFASLILLGVKTIETKSWPTSFRGEILIHASKSQDIRCRQAAYHSLLRPLLKKHFSSLQDMPKGMILGVVTITGCVPVEALPDQLDDIQEVCGWYEPGRYGWLLEKPHQFSTPLPYKGSKGIWQIPDHLIEQHLITCSK